MLTNEDNIICHEGLHFLTQIKCFPCRVGRPSLDGDS